MKQRILVEGDESLIEPHEILITSDENFETIFKERADIGFKTSVLLTIEDFVNRLEMAYKEGYDNGQAEVSKTK